MSAKKNKSSITWIEVSWFALAVAAVVFYFIASGFVAFPDKYKMPLLIALIALAACMAVLTFLNKKGKTAAGVVNVLLSAAMVAGSIFIPSLESRMKKIFTELPESEEMTINFYAFTTEYKEAHPEIMKASNVMVTSNNIADYSSSTFITQSATDTDNQEFAVTTLLNELGRDSVMLAEKEDLGAALDAFYAGEGEVLVMNEAYLPMVTAIDGFENFSEETTVVYSVKKEVSSTGVPRTDKDVTREGFTVLVAGSDTRSSRLSQYGRTDVDILMAVDPVNYQILIVSFPRDSYIPNPALNDGYDKLTHLGNDGIGNTMVGISNYVGVPVDHYVLVNFSTFRTIIDAIGGIDIYNPYYFTSGHDAGYGEFPEGDIHLEGAQALSYARERQNLPDGDFGRNTHQVIVLKAILSKLTSPEILTHYDDILNALEGQFLTSVDAGKIYELAGNTLDHDGGWKIVTYHMGGEGMYAETISMPGRDLYCVRLFDSQTEYIKEEINKVLMGENIEEGELPDAEDTVYLPN